MAGLDLPVKLRRGLGKGKVVAAEELTRMLAPFDGDQDGALNRAELTKFLQQHRVGGPWFCQVLTKTIWKLAEERWAKEVDSITVEALGRVIHYSMNRPDKPSRRYILTPAAIHGLEDKQYIGDDPNAGRSAPARPSAAPLGESAQTRPRSSGAAPRSTAPRAAPSAGSPPSARAGVRPGPRGAAPRRPGPKPRQ